MSNITCFTDEKRLRVYVQNVPVCTGTTRTHVETCARGAGKHGDVFERTHGDVLSGHTWFFSVSHTTPHGERDSDRQRERERKKRLREREEKRREEKRREEKRGEERRGEERRGEERRGEEKRREEKRREEIHFQWCMAVFC